MWIFFLQKMGLKPYEQKLSFKTVHKHDVQEKEILNICYNQKHLLLHNCVIVFYKPTIVFLHSRIHTEQNIQIFSLVFQLS
jgi:hypothetical protein